MVADSQLTQGRGTILSWPEKIVRLERPLGDQLLGAAGSIASLVLFLGWFRAGAVLAKRPKIPEDTITVLVMDRFGMTVYQDECAPIKVYEPYCAIGSGDQYARGAIEAGATAEEAVKIAARLDYQTGGPLQVEYLEPEKG